jgi:hypothetical protein
MKPLNAKTVFAVPYYFQRLVHFAALSAPANRRLLPARGLETKDAVQALIKLSRDRIDVSEIGGLLPKNPQAGH